METELEDLPEEIWPPIFEGVISKEEAVLLTRFLLETELPPIGQWRVSDLPPHIVNIWDRVDEHSLRSKNLAPPTSVH